MGHARAYLTFDILRRIMQDYFHYEIIYHSNITDIDDKIILRARRNHLIDLYCAKKPSTATACKDIDAAQVAAGAKLEKKLVDLKALEPTESREKAENENEIKMAELKISQFKTTSTNYDLLKMADKQGPYTLSVLSTLFHTTLILCAILFSSRCGQSHQFARRQRQHRHQA